jgi:hypothetical protein
MTLPVQPDGTPRQKPPNRFSDISRSLLRVLAVGFITFNFNAKIRIFEFTTMCWFLEVDE